MPHKGSFKLIGCSVCHLVAKWAKKISSLPALVMCYNGASCFMLVQNQMIHM